MIKLLLIGHLGKDAIEKEVGGAKVINFSAAHTEKWTDKQGNKKEKTTWVDCNYWTEKTGILPYLKKGTQVYVEGTPEADTYQNQQGSPVAVQRCRVFSVQLLGSSTAEAAPAAAAPPPPPQPVWNGTAWVIPTSAAAPAAKSTAQEAADDLPF